MLTSVKHHGSHYIHDGVSMTVQQLPAFVTNAQTHQRTMLSCPKRIPLPEASLLPTPLDGAFPRQRGSKPHQGQDITIGCLPSPLDEIGIQQIQTFDKLVVLFSAEHDVKGQFVRSRVFGSDHASEVGEVERLSTSCTRSELERPSICH